MRTVDATLTIGDQAPDVALMNDTEQGVALASLWKEQPLVLVFVRHLGCPLCRAHLTQLRDEYPRFRAARAEIAAVTMSPPVELAPFRESHRLPFRLLSDVGQIAYRAYGPRRGSLLAISGPSIWRKAWNALQTFGAGKIAGDPYQLSGEFVIGTNGLIRFVHYAKNSADWADVDSLIEAIGA